ncbi:hypothetical protein BC829DRAFT_436722 [Chytridium lagenaria]|nr:hypothetical protein BC829DRAFT_436722 [Chytridium lagenaria]
MSDTTYQCIWLNLPHIHPNPLKAFTNLFRVIDFFPVSQEIALQTSASIPIDTLSIAVVAWIHQFHTTAALISIPKLIDANRLDLLKLLHHLGSTQITDNTMLYAIQHNRLEVVRYLSKKCGKRSTYKAICWAHEAGNWDMVRLLRKIPGEWRDGIEGAKAKGELVSFLYKNPPYQAFVAMEKAAGNRRR